MRDHVGIDGPVAGSHRRHLHVDGERRCIGRNGHRICGPIRTVGLGVEFDNRSVPRRVSHVTVPVPIGETHVGNIVEGERVEAQIQRRTNTES